MESFLHFFQIGGWAMVGIVGCSIVAVAIFLERLWVLRPNKVSPRPLAVEVESLVEQGRLEDAKVLCKKSETHLSNILHAAIDAAGREWEYIKGVVEEAGERETLNLEQFMSVLGMIVMLAPLLGFLGTVSGMIDLFSAIAARGEVQNIGELAGGIYKALYTTAAGLSVAIPVLIFHKICIAKSTRLLRQMEEVAFKVIGKLK